MLSKKIILACICAGLIAISLFFPLPAKAAISYYVSTSGNDSNPGTLAQPWKTLQKAANTMVAGDIVLVRSGTYINGISLTKSGTASAYITYQAYPGEHPVLSGSNWFGFSDYYGSGSSYVIVDGFEIIGGEFGFYFSKGSGNLILRNNTVHGQTNTGFSMSNSVTGEIYGNTIYGVTGYNGFDGAGLNNYSIHNNQAYSNNNNGILVSFSTSNTAMYGNVVFGNGCGTDQVYAGIAIEVSSEHNKVYNNLAYNNCHAGYITNSSNNEIYNNVFYGNTEYQVLFGDWSGSIPINNVYENNVFVVIRSADHALGNFHSGTTYDTLKNTFNYNNYYYTGGADKNDLIRLDSNYSFAQWKSAGNESKGMLANPNFIGSTDFHLNNNSPLIDAGSNLGSLVPIDFDGVVRPLGSGFDIGAFEVQSSSQPTTAPTRTATLAATATLKSTNTPFASLTRTRTATLTATATLKPTNTPLASSTPTRTATLKATATLKPTNTPLVSSTPTRTATLKATATLKPTNTPQLTNTPLPSLTPSPTPMFTPTTPGLATIDLFAPMDGMALLNNQPTFGWSEMSDAVNYNIQISKNSTFTQLVTNATVIPTTYMPATNLPAGKTLFWRVRPKLAAGYGSWSVAYSIHTALPPSAPKPLKPTNKALTNDYTPALDWTDSIVPDGASAFDHYLLQVATDPAFTDATEISISGITNSHYTFPSELDPSTKFYWRVGSYKINGEYGAWSSVRTFRTPIRPPTLLDPEDGLSTTNRLPTFAWSEVEGASSYILRVSKSSTFSSSIIKVTVTSASYTPSITLPVGTLYWRVQAKDSNGPSPWSETRTMIEN